MNNVVNTIELANKMLIFLPMLFGVENVDHYDELSSNILETSVLGEPFDNGDGTLTDYLAYSEKGHFGDGKIGLYKLIRSWVYNPFIEENSIYTVQELLPFEERRISSIDTENGIIHFIGDNEKDLAYNVFEERFVENT